MSPSFRSKASHFVDLTTVLLNPISDKPSNLHDVTEEMNSNKELSVAEENPKDTVDGPDTSSFTAFLYSLLLPQDSGSLSEEEGNNGYCGEVNELGSSEAGIREMANRRTLFLRGKQKVGKAIYQAIRINGSRNQTSEQKVDADMKDDKLGLELQPMKTLVDTAPKVSLPETSETSILLTEKSRCSLYVSLPALVQGKKWVLLYSTWRHGISLLTLYRRSMLCPGLSLLVVGDRKGAIFGGLVEAPLRPSNKRKYQGTNNSFVFTNTSGHPVVFHPTDISIGIQLLKF
ncbi:hypothetical protein GIB67_013967 [Kingdonia uniflora]|uniref:Oxidation resistance protein 1 n=1 Tax=Kingdonia uniflora TaxID=39325 RepID=A0A7J7LDS8_9MAGN|nr:hypothetical protein GIB67_013967 [Kingdonia uniflora]